ncbi:hypothetical protein K9B35_00105 [Sphingomonas sp. R647]|uniref:hypothetical protein n=1 Tax=Sphingomonas sp. R647 TaxID=2875233 RepID=UPI001CD27EEA|nr:hypothetical protein [Sphingomonas sp. R647]MCA1196356.1 hypothetical protein [Sphingomonas sp. R647]
MFKKTAASLAMIGTLAFASVSAQASQVRPAAVQLDSKRVQSISAIGRDARVSTRPGKRNNATPAFLLPLIAVVAVTVTVVAVASGGGDSSPN